MSYVIKMDYCDEKLEPQPMGCDFALAEVPYVTMRYAGLGYGRWRVKARNALADSDWSEWQYFRFVQTKDGEGGK
jgi:hypothetical protein